MKTKSIKKSKKTISVFCILLITAIFICGCSVFSSKNDNSSKSKESNQKIDNKSKLSSKKESDDEKNKEKKDDDKPKKKKKEKWLTIYPYKNSKEYYEVGEGEEIPAYGDDMPEDIKFVAHTEGLTVMLDTIDFDENFETLYFVGSANEIVPEVGKVYSFKGAMPEAIPYGRIVVYKDGMLSDFILSYNGFEEENKIEIFSDNIKEVEAPDENTNIISLCKAFAQSCYINNTDKLDSTSDYFWDTIAYAITNYSPKIQENDDDSIPIKFHQMSYYHHALFPDDTDKFIQDEEGNLGQFIYYSPSERLYRVDDDIDILDASFEKIEKTKQKDKKGNPIYKVFINLDTDDGEITKKVKIAPRKENRLYSPFHWVILGIED